jgi:hypothetical protein
MNRYANNITNNSIVQSLINYEIIFYIFLIFCLYISNIFKINYAVEKIN